MIDGIIKYNFDFKKSKPLQKDLWQEIEQIRERLYALGLIGVKNGIGYGNISQKIDKNSFVITGTQTGNLPTLKEEHYSLIEDFDDAKFYLKSSGAVKPSSEALTHGTIYNLNDNIEAVIHIHSEKLWDFMLESNYKKTKDVPYGSIEMIQEIKRVYTDANPLDDAKLVMSGHHEGVIAFGKNLKEAELTLYEVIEDFFKSSR
jgi:ribulose-5-phosphate 4-epimerase/fuculose-1-phosphate aldolase